jgi:hypothetical protein
MPDETYPLPFTELTGTPPNGSASFGTELNQSDPVGTPPTPSAPDGIVPNATEPFRNVPNVSADFRSVPPSSVPGGTVPSGSAAFGPRRKETHTLTVREVARLFEAAGVARTERSVTKWCQPNPHGLARLDAYYDPNERRYFVTRQSVDAAIAEEKARQARFPVEPRPAAPIRTEPNPPEPSGPAPSRTETRPRSSEAEPEAVAQLRRELRDLQITNRGKDYFIERLEKERDRMLQQVVEANRTVGQLETRLLQLGGPDRPELGETRPSA